MKTLYERFHGWLWVAAQHYWLPLVWMLLSVMAFAGCNGIHVDIDAMPNPLFKKPTPPAEHVQPAPPAPQPPPDDWAPPWFRRHTPNPKALNASPIPKVKR